MKCELVSGPNSQHGIAICFYATLNTQLALKAQSRGAYVDVFVLVRTSVRQPLWQLFVHLEEITPKTAICWLQGALLEQTDKMAQQASYRAFSENAIAHSMLAVKTGKKAGLFCQTAPVPQGLGVYGFCWLQFIRVKPCSQQVTGIQSQAMLCTAKSAAQPDWCLRAMLLGIAKRMAS